jgi:hypothetical protein
MNEEAYEIYLRSLALGYDPTPASKQGIELLEDSVHRDPNYAPAWYELARREYMNFRYGDGGALTERRWLFAINQLLKIDPGNVAATAGLVVRSAEGGQSSEALREATELVRRAA